MLPLDNDTTVNYHLHRTKNAGKSTLLAAASAAKPKIADYPFTTIFPNLGVCDIGDEGAGLVLCDIPGLIEGAAEGTGLGLAFLRHVRRCKVLLHVVDGNAEDPIGDFLAINKELQAYDDILAQKPQVVVLNKVDIPEVQEKQEKLLEGLKRISGHGRVLTISAATTYRVKELMGRLKKFVSAQPEDDEENPAEIDFSLSALDMDSDDYGASMVKKWLPSILLRSLFVTKILTEISLFPMTLSARFVYSNCK
jgi:GTP-binding protein